MTGAKAGPAGLVVAGLLVVMMLAAIAGAIGAPDDGQALALGRDLRAGAVPAVYQQAVAAAGTRCPAAPAPVLAAQLEAESSWEPQAVSPAGAQGMAQFMPGTWAIYGLDGDRDGKADPFDPLDAIASQAAYDCALAQQLAPALAVGQVHGDLTSLMLAAYDAGPDKVIRYGGVPPYDETTHYVQRITTRALSYATAPALPGTQPGQTAPGGLGARIVAAAMTQLNVPYAWGGGDATGPTRGSAQGAGTVGFDCSGLVIFAVAQATGGRVQLPHFADTQTRTGTAVLPDQLQPGDLISFTRAGESVAHHIGIYAGAGRMVHAPETGSVVSVVSLSTPYWKGQSWRATRIG